ncbi:substrate-binding domain-containing protein (plasmid) [Nostoc sp. UHCC 0926]|uniref:substrate-binding domain-containing protein n=1 Tax=Nostoc sp. UHCC 0926 TaxID=3025190 RepID=UPI002361B239|nr:substrate-binding domain-containing protein [Nostoc sp. UHCC 0926]WDD36618.1 substrate-binding domain-containing protein [Nostoc sp. UHCC 0926]
MKLDVNLCNNLKSIRTRLGMSQQDLANKAGVTRQSIGGVESGQYAPSVAISLRLAKALGCPVKDLFCFEEDLPEVQAVLSKPVKSGQQLRVSLARVGGKWIAYPLVGNDAFRIEMIPADGEVVAVSHPVVGSGVSASGSDVGASPVRVDGFPDINKLLNLEGEAVAVRHPVAKRSLSKGSSNSELSKVSPVDKLAKGLRGISTLPFSGGVKAEYLESELQNQTGRNKVLVRLLDDIDKLENTVVIAGCTPMISLWARAAERRHPQLRVHHIFANSMTALRSLCRGEIHIAGMHLYDPETGEHNIPFVRQALAGRSAVLITLGVWEEGLLVPPGNPKGIKTVSDLVELGITIVNRELGCGSRMLLERKLQEEQISLHTVKGFDHIVYNHQDIALSVVSGIADAGVSTASVAAAFGLGFIPLHRSRYDLVILKEYLEEIPVQQLLSTLGHRLVQSQLEVLGGYDISNIGEVVANI